MTFISLTTDNLKAYPAVYTPVRVKDFINEGYNKDVILKELSLHEAEEKDYIELQNLKLKKENSLNDNYSRYLNFSTKDYYKISEIFKLNNESKTYDLENCRYVLDSLVLPLKPTFYNSDIKKDNKIQNFLVKLYGYCAIFILSSIVLSFLFYICIDSLSFFLQDLSIVRLSILSSLILSTLIIILLIRSGENNNSQLVFIETL